MGIKDQFAKLCERPQEETVQLGVSGIEVTVHRVSPLVAMRCAGKATQGNEDEWLAELAAYSIYEEDARPLANDEGVGMVKSLPPGDFMALAAAAMRVNGFDQPGNLQRASGSSTGSASPSDADTLTA